MTQQMNYDGTVASVGCTCVNGEITSLSCCEESESTTSIETDRREIYRRVIDLGTPTIMGMRVESGPFTLFNPPKSGGPVLSGNGRFDPNPPPPQVPPPNSFPGPGGPEGGGTGGGEE